MSNTGKGYWIDRVVRDVTNADYHQQDDIQNIGDYSPAGGKPQRYRLTPDGVTTVFTLDVSPVASVFQLYWNGMLMDEADYQLSGNQLTTTGFVAQVGDSLVYFA